MNASKKDLYDLDDFVGKVENEYITLSNLTKYLVFDKDDKKVIDVGMDILKKKIKAMKKADNVEKIKDHVKVKKILSR